MAQQAEMRIGEPDGAIRLHHDIVGGVQAAALVMARQDRDGPVVFGADDPPAAMLAGDEAALPVAGVAVGLLAGLSENRDGAGLLVPAQDAVIGNVADQQAALVAQPDGTLAPAQAGGEALHRGIEQAVLQEPRIEDLDGRVGIDRARLPHAHLLVAALPAGGGSVGRPIGTRKDRRRRPPMRKGRPEGRPVRGRINPVSR